MGALLVNINFLSLGTTTGRQQIDRIQTSFYLYHIEQFNSMGAFVSRAVEKNMKSNQEFMLEMNRITVERQLQMQNQMRERMAAMQIAKNRELLNWFGSFYLLTAAGMLTGYKKSRRPGILVPLVPLSFIFAYQIDLAYGNKLHRIRGEAENIINYESELLELPCNLPSLSTIDQARQIRSDQLKMHSAHQPLYY